LVQALRRADQSHLVFDVVHQDERLNHRELVNLRGDVGYLVQLVFYRR
jgi:hypothetical protein